MKIKAGLREDKPVHGTRHRDTENSLQALHLFLGKHPHVQPYRVAGAPSITCQGVSSKPKIGSPTAYSPGLALVP